MKNTIFFIFLFIASNFTFAQQSSSLTIFSEDGDGFYLFLNGVRQNQRPEVNINIDFLQNSYYDTKIVFANKNIPNLKKSYMNVVDMDGNVGNVVYKIKRTKRGKMVMRYYSFTPFQDYHPATENVTIIHHNVTPMPEIDYAVVTTQTTTTTNSSNGENVNVGINVGGVNIGMNVNINDGMSNGSTTTTTTTTTTTSGNVLNDVIIIEEDVIDCYTLNNADFRDALESIKRKSFSDSKLILAKQVTKRNCLTANQIKTITALFDFESTKLEFAKYAYPFCYNPENYWKINDVFDFESSIEELDEFIESQR